MMKSRWLCFVLILTLNANAQTSLDSLYGIWLDTTQKDSIRANTYGQYIWKSGLLYKNPDSAFILAEELEIFAKNKNLPNIQAWANNLQGIYFYRRGNYPKALEYHQRSLKIRKRIGDKIGVASSLANIGNCYQDQGYYPQALNFVLRSLEIQEELKDKRGIAQSLNNIGNIYGLQNNYQKALDYFERSLKLKEELEDKRGIAKTLGNIGVIYYEEGNFPKALDYYSRSLTGYEEIEDKMGVSISLNNIGVIYSDKNNYQEALSYYNRSLNIYEEIGDKYGIAETLLGIGKDLNKQNKYSLAITKCEESLEMSTEIGVIDLQENACNCLYTAHKALNNGKKALAYHEQMVVLNDSIQNEETSKRLQQMEFKKMELADSLLQVEKDLKVNIAHQTEVRKKNVNKNIALGAGTFFLLLAGGFYSRWRYVKKTKSIIEKEKGRSDKLLLNILPKEVAEELKNTGRAATKKYEDVSILFTDFKGFTELVATIPATTLVEELNHIFGRFDDIMDEFDIEKIETIGDAYMAACGLPKENEDHALKCVQAAQKMIDFLTERNRTNEIQWHMRVGIHSGPVVAGVVGKKKFAYDLFGDSVNTASRMESNGEAEKINISQTTYELLKDNTDFNFESRGKILAKGKGQMEMYFVETRL